MSQTPPPTSDGKRRMVSVAEACKRLNESPSYFYKHSIRKLRFYKAGRATRIDDSSVDELIEQRLAENPANPQKPRQGRPRKTQSLAALTEQPAAGA